MNTYIDAQATFEILRFLETSKSQSEFILDSLPGLFLITDSRGLILRGNRHAAELLKVNFENLIGQLFSRTMASAWVEFSKKMVESKKFPLEGIDFKMAISDGDLSQKYSLWNIRPLSVVGHDGSDLNIYLIFGRG